MTVLERQLRDLVRDAAPAPDWVDALAQQALGDTSPAPVRPRSRYSRRTMVGAGAIAIGLAGAVLAVALRHPETAPPPAATAATTTPTTPTEPQAASPLGAALRTVGVAAKAPDFTGFRAALADQVVPDSVREIRAARAVYAYELRNGAACLDVAGALDCAVPAAHRLLLDGALAQGDTAEVLVVVAPDVASVTIDWGGRTIPVELDGRLGRAVLPRASGADLRYVVSLRDGSTQRIGRPWPTGPRQAPAPPPSGPGLLNGRQILAQAGTPIAIADATLSVVDFAPIEGTLRLLARDFGASGSNVYGWLMKTKQRTTWLCLGDAETTTCGVPLDAHVLWLGHSPGSTYLDTVVGIAAPDVVAAWLRFADGTRIDATLHRHVITAAIPAERTTDDVHLFAQLADGTVVDERRELLR